MNLPIDGKENSNSKRTSILELLGKLALFLACTLFGLTFLAFKLYGLIAPIRETLIVGCVLLLIWVLFRCLHKYGQ